MATEVKLPRLGQGMDEGRILSWLKGEGDVVDKGDEIYEVETEKVNVEVEAPAAGTILKIAVGEGQTVPIGTVIAWIGDQGESVPDAGGAPESTDAVSAKPTGPATSATPAKPAAAETGNDASAGGSRQSPVAGDDVSEGGAPQDRAGMTESFAGRDEARAASSAAVARDATTIDTPAAGSADGRRLRASPLARRMARERGLSLEQVQGTGPDGRIVARDLDGVAASDAGAGAAAGAGQTTGVAEPAITADGPGVERVALSSMRRTIARRLGEAWQAPAFYLTRHIDMTRANELRAQLVAGLVEGDVRPTISDVITRACAVALRRHRDMNVHFAGDAILRFEAVHVGLAVATDDGLVVPVIRDAHALTVREIAAERKALVGRARAGKLALADFEGGTFTISNLGMMGIDEFTAVLNPPMAGILAVGRTEQRVVAISRRPEVRPMMTVTLGCDHRAVDGAVGARFLDTVAQHLEQPTTML